MNYRIIQVVIAVLAIVNSSAQLSAQVVVSQEPIQDTELIIDTREWKLSGADFTKYGMCPVRVTITNTGSEQATYQLGPDTLSVDAVFARLSYREWKRVLAIFFTAYLSFGMLDFVRYYSPVMEKLEKRGYYAFHDYRLPPFNEMYEVVMEEIDNDYVLHSQRFEIISVLRCINLIATPILYWRYIHNTNNKLRMALDEIIVAEVFVLEPGQTATGVIISSEKGVLPVQQNNALE